MTYFHRRTSTIIGAKAFHGPVRDGKAWDHLAMVVKRNWFALWPSCCQPGPKANLKKKHTAPSGSAVSWPRGVTYGFVCWVRVRDCYINLFERHLKRITYKVIGSSRTGN